MSTLYKYLCTPEKNGRKIGLFRILSAIFGGLIVSYLGMTLLAFIIPVEIAKSAIISIMFNTFAWAIAATWISLSFTKLEALLRFLVPSFIFAILLYILY
ncbi:hypothetical protein [Halarcobacter ebronensis]|uniref:Uncharacterized protein n=1 Tax=Halarcobacter ebronensis TaxID=1462615 RepID=A0A4Q1ARC2_9BACT|nr:hypothetical protein [Halarcobacter ebronensis]QKF81005.1 putative membrane protein [Halarcobacter ebronensis]RXK06319.1 hypothetical protein CRV07_06370 [Halarcobacter ebronensis]